MSSQDGSIAVELREPSAGTVLISLTAVAGGLVMGAAGTSAVTYRVWGQSGFDALTSGDRRQQFGALVVALVVGSLTLSVSTKAAALVVSNG